MTGPEHYVEAERLLGQASSAISPPDFYEKDAGPTIAAAQVHATLALAAATEFPAWAQAHASPMWSV